jgi:hypothetical protein
MQEALRLTLPLGHNTSTAIITYFYGGHLTSCFLGIAWEHTYNRNRNNDLCSRLNKSED